MKLKYVYLVNGRWVYRPRIPKAKQGLIPVDKSGFLKPPVRLGKEGDPVEKILIALTAAKEQLKFHQSKDRYSVGWLFDEYLSSKTYQDLAIRTRRDYENLVKNVKEWPVKINGNQSVFSNVKVPQITKTMVRRLINNRYEQYQAAGHDGAVRTNRELAVLSVAISWGSELYDGLVQGVNPCFGIKRFKEHKRDRYVTDDEYFIQWKMAHEVGADYLPILMEHTYLMASRGIEARELRLSDIKDDIVTVRRKKGSKTNQIRRTERHEEAYQKALGLRKRYKVTETNPYVIPGPNGGKLNESTVQSAMRRLKKLMDSRGVGHIYWTTHDLKRKGISDAENNRIGGHKNEAMREQYNTKVEIFDSVR